MRTVMKKETENMNVYVIKLGDKFVKTTSYGFYSFTSNPERASRFKTLKEARARSKRVIDASTAKPVVYKLMLTLEVA